MQTHTEDTTTWTDGDEGFDDLLAGYRFKVCETPEEVADALEVRRQVYCEGLGYSIPCPDDYDHRSWILRAECAATGKCIGTMRLTPRFAGSFECEEYFELPRRLRGSACLEISRFAILPEHRRGSTMVPTVAFGLFKLCYEFALAIGSTHQVVCSKPSRTWTYTQMGFEATGDEAPYGKLDGALHELLAVRFDEAPQFLRDNPFKVLFLETAFDEVMLPNRRPPLGLVPDTREFRFAVGA
jgi:N-acyl-L-homoserine lactone synthetase